MNNMNSFYCKNIDDDYVLYLITSADAPKHYIMADVVIQDTLECSIEFQLYFVFVFACLMSHLCVINSNHSKWSTWIKKLYDLLCACKLSWINDTQTIKICLWVICSKEWHQGYCRSRSRFYHAKSHNKIWWEKNTMPIWMQILCQ